MRRVLRKKERRPKWEVTDGKADKVMLLANVRTVVIWDSKRIRKQTSGIKQMMLRIDDVSNEVNHPLLVAY
ncbi:hypothetical protein KSX_53390 [Ktedonospora formicarum]|uniref:Transposase n=1 Tax=Ktedonospora formicarum TaxID=2778364 RepID=A0A8J3I431_9CHLR|nr:hypothetical protein KSX_53390 [Ktedonospora formicarum]